MAWAAASGAVLVAFGRSPAAALRSRPAGDGRTSLVGQTFASELQTMPLRRMFGRAAQTMPVRQTAASLRGPLMA